MATVPKKVPSLTLNDGSEMPVLGLGTWKSQPGEVTEAVKDAIDLGYRYIDGALLCQNEKEVGAAIKAKVDEGIIKREDMFILGKLWCTFHRPDLVLSSLKTTLRDLGLEYLNLYLIHWPMAFKEGDELDPKDAGGNCQFSEVDYLDTWKAMEECVSLGLTKSIGVSNFNSEQIQRILSNCTIKPAMVQVECNPYLTQKKLMEFCKSKNIAVTAYSPLGSPDRVWAKPTDPKLLDEPKLIEIGNKYGKSPAQVVLRWILQRDIVVIPKSVHKDRLAQNIDVFDFTLTEDDMNEVFSLDCNGRAVAAEFYKEHKYYPFNIEF